MHLYKAQLREEELQVLQVPMSVASIRTHLLFDQVGVAGSASATSHPSKKMAALVMQRQALFHTVAGEHLFFKKKKKKRVIRPKEWRR